MKQKGARRVARRPRSPARRPLVGTLAVVGVGLIGGSFALALKRAGAVGRVIGVGRTRANLLAARRLGIIDDIAADVGAAVAQADLVLLATPLGQMGHRLAEIAPHLRDGAILTDAGSTKQDVIAAARQCLGPRFSQFVPGHPIAGTEKSGATAAHADLFDGRNLILTPVAETDRKALARVARLWRLCGMKIAQMEPAEHDRVFAAVSHLPHLLAFALVDSLARGPDAPRVLRFAGGGFRDFTRIAASSPEMWRDIFRANRAALLAELDRYEQELAEMRAVIEHDDRDALDALLERASATRNRWASGRPH